MTMCFFQALNNKNVLKAECWIIPQVSSSAQDHHLRRSCCCYYRRSQPRQAPALTYSTSAPCYSWRWQASLSSSETQPAKIFKPFYAIIEDKKISEILGVKISEALCAKKWFFWKNCLLAVILHDNDQITCTMTRMELLTYLTLAVSVSWALCVWETSSSLFCSLSTLRGRTIWHNEESNS